MKYSIGFGLLVASLAALAACGDTADGELAQLRSASIGGAAGGNVGIGTAAGGNAANLGAYPGGTPSVGTPAGGAPGIGAPAGGVPGLDGNGGGEGGGGGGGGGGTPNPDTCPADLCAKAASCGANDITFEICEGLCEFDPAQAACYLNTPCALIEAACGEEEEPPRQDLCEDACEFLIDDCGTGQSRGQCIQGCLSDTSGLTDCIASLSDCEDIAFCSE